MKCQHCGRHEATFHYRSNVNGQITEQHLCSECASMEGSVFAAEKQHMQMFAAPFMQSMGYGSLFNDMARGFFGPWPGVTRAMPQTQGPVQPDSINSRNEELKIPVDAGEDFKKRREINQLRCELDSAVKAEKFERAAELRDKIYKLENNK